MQRPPAPPPGNAERRCGKDRHVLAGRSERPGWTAVNNNALVAALGSDAVAAVHGYRLEVVEEARLRGLTLRSAPTGPGADPLDVRLVFADGPAGALTGQVLVRARSVAGRSPGPSPTPHRATSPGRSPGPGNSCPRRPRSSTGSPAADAARWCRHWTWSWTTTRPSSAGCSGSRRRAVAGSASTRSACPPDLGRAQFSAGRTTSLRSGRRSMGTGSHLHAVAEHEGGFPGTPAAVTPPTRGPPRPRRRVPHPCRRPPSGLPTPGPPPGPRRQRRAPRTTPRRSAP